MLVLNITCTCCTVGYLVAAYMYVVVSVDQQLGNTVYYLHFLISVVYRSCICLRGVISAVHARAALHFSHQRLPQARTLGLDSKQTSGPLESPCEFVPQHTVEFTL